MYLYSYKSYKFLPISLTYVKSLSLNRFYKISKSHKIFIGDLPLKICQYLNPKTTNLPELQDLQEGGNIASPSYFQK